MNEADVSFDEQLAMLWGSIDSYEPKDFVLAIDALTASHGKDHSIALFEKACARDSTGSPDLAVPLYRAALSAGLEGMRRRRANIQLASSLRNLGHADEALELLERESLAGSDELDGAVQAFLALTLTDLGREREAVSISLKALAAYLPRYNRSLANYAGELVNESA